MSRLLAYVFGFGTVVLVASPIAWEPWQDSYPLSTYPMFSGRRDKPTVYFMQAVDQAGQTQRIAPKLVATDEVMQAAATVRRAVATGPRAMQELCESVAHRVATSRAHAAATHVEIVSARDDPVRYFEAHPVPEQSTRHLSCKVRGGS